MKEIEYPSFELTKTKIEKEISKPIQIPESFLENTEIITTALIVQYPVFNVPKTKSKEVKHNGKIYKHKNKSRCKR